MGTRDASVSARGLLPKIKVLMSKYHKVQVCLVIQRSHSPRSSGARLAILQREQ
jgi:hypothetical protein